MYKKFELLASVVSLKCRGVSNICDFSDVSSAGFLSLGNVYTKTKYRQKLSTKNRRFKSFFGITPKVCSIVWEKIRHDRPIGFSPKHLLWGLNFLKQYTNEENRHSIFQADEKTIRKWTWIAVGLLSDMNVVILFKSLGCV